MRKRRPADGRGRKTPYLMMVCGLAGMVLIKYLQSGLLVWGGTHIVSGYYWISTMVLAAGMFLWCLRIPVSRYVALRWFSRTCSRRPRQVRENEGAAEWPSRTGKAPSAAAFSCRLPPQGQAVRSSRSALRPSQRSWPRPTRPSWASSYTRPRWTRHWASAHCR